MVLRLKKSISLRTKLAIYFMLLCVLVSALITGFLYYNFKLELRAELKNRLFSITSIAALQQDGDTILKITSAGDENYKKINEQNLKIRESDPDLAYVYTAMKNEQGIYFVVDANMPGDEGIAAFGEPYLEPSPLLAENFDTLNGTIIEPEIYTDEWDSFLSAYAPIYTSAGEKIGVLGVDITADRIIAKERRFLTISLGIFSASLPIILLLGFLLGRIIVAPILNLTKTAERITAGDLNAKAAVETGDETGRLANAFNIMTVQLQELVNSSEQRVEERTNDLEISNQRNEHRAKQYEAISQVARAITSIQNLEILLQNITKLISEQFGFYHVGVFLLDDGREFAVLMAANSTGGKKMLARNHKLKIGQVGIVGYVTSSGNPRVALDTGADAIHFDNPDLPDTRSELALPLQIGKQIIGALDVQSLESNAFSQDDVQILATLADQIAIAIQNARSFEESRKLLQEAQSTFSSYMTESWQALRPIQKGLGYQFSGNSIKVLERPIEGAHIKDALKKGVVIISGENSDHLAIPVRLRGQVIGVMNLQNPAGQAWDQDQIDIATATAERLSLAIENATLLQATQRRADIERVTTNISTRISSSTHFETILQTAAEELSRALSGSDVLVQIEPIAIELGAIE